MKRKVKLNSAIISMLLTIVFILSSCTTSNQTNESITSGNCGIAKPVDPSKYGASFEESQRYSAEVAKDPAIQCFGKGIVSCTESEMRVESTVYQVTGKTSEGCSVRVTEKDKFIECEIPSYLPALQTNKYGEAGHLIISMLKLATQIKDPYIRCTGPLAATKSVDELYPR